MSLRDDLLPTFNQAVGIIDSLGLQRYQVTIRTRTWKNAIGDVPSGYTDSSITLTPNPTVEELSPAQMMGLMGPGGSFVERFYKITDITPAFTDPNTNTSGGYTPQQLAPFAPPGGGKVEVTYILTGDDGQPFECVFAAQDFTDPFEYQLTVRQKRRPHSDANAP